MVNAAEAWPRRRLTVKMSTPWRIHWEAAVCRRQWHELEAQPPAWRVDAERDGWRRVHLLAGRVHCASGDCHRLGPPPGRRRPEVGQEFRLAARFGEPCSGHGGTTYDRLYHREEHDPEDHSGEPQQSHAAGLFGPDGTFWHYWCAPLEGRGLFGFLRQEELTDGAVQVVGGSAPHVS